jgi:hypothetical protein
VTAPRHIAVFMLALVVVAGCGSSSSTGKAHPSPGSPARAAAASPHAAYAHGQAQALGRVDYAAGEVLYLDPAHTTAGVLAQKIRSLSTAARAAAQAVAQLHPPAGAASLQRQEVSQLRAYARRLDAWVKSHPKRTVSGAGDVIHGGRLALDRTVDALASKHLVD